MRAPGHEHHHRLRFCETGEVIEVAVRSERVVDVAIAHRLHAGRQNGNTARPHHGHQLTAAPFEFRKLHTYKPPATRARRPNRRG